MDRSRLHPDAVAASLGRDGVSTEVLFLSEAFTRPAMMSKLAEIGFSQSYTYFTWRHEKVELTEYVEQLAHGPLADVMRPNFWPNTPDILGGVLRHGNRAAFLLRYLLAATLTPNFGVYSGYELRENEGQWRYHYTGSCHAGDLDWDQWCLKVCQAWKKFHQETGAGQEYERDA